MINQNFSSLGFAVSQELGNKQTHRLTDSLTFYCFDRVIEEELSSNISQSYFPLRNKRRELVEERGMVVAGSKHVLELFVFCDFFS